MKKYLTIATFSFLLTFCSSTQKSESLAQYKSNGYKLTALLKKATLGDLPQIKAISEVMLKNASSLYSELAETQKQCAPYLKVVDSKIATMKTLTKDQIEEQYHAGSALPENDNADCVELKELAVHPATVVVLAEKDSKSESLFEDMSAEIEEVLHHLDVIEELL